jgi:outer membrane protein OmpA-like peptidoglycan-associated protein
VCLLLCAVRGPIAHAQIEEDVAGSTVISGAGERDSEADRWWLGAYFRHLWIPPYMTDPFFSRAPSVSNNGFGLTATYRTGSGLNLVMGVGYMPYEFFGPFLAEGRPITDTELVQSDLALWHVTASLLWDIEFHHTIALEIGFGIDAGMLTGRVRRNEAFLDDRGMFQDCVGPLNPPVTDARGDLFCDLPQNGSGRSGTDDPRDEGEHYNVVEDRVPPVILFPMVPHVALRVQPFKHLMIKAEFAFGVVQLWAGISLHMSFGVFERGPEEVFVPPESDVGGNGRVLGRVVDDSTGAPVAGAIVKMTARALSPLSTELDGRFIVDRLDAGLVRFEVEHPEYARGRCEVDVPKQGGDVAVECHLVAHARVGSISGQLKDEQGAPVARAKIELQGGRNELLEADEYGAFAAVDLPPGPYRVKVEAEGFLVQLVEVEVRPHETALPQIILIAKPKRSVVQLRKQEIVITEQIQFRSSSAEILDDSADVLRQVADVLLRHPQIELVEIQGHTDSTGTHQRNMELSQGRAESVRAWLVQAGVTADRLQAKGYGPDQPIRANDTPANRAKNRRVQFIIRKQAAEIDGVE